MGRGGHTGDAALAAWLRRLTPIAAIAAAINLLKQPPYSDLGFYYELAERLVSGDLTLAELLDPTPAVPADLPVIYLPGILGALLAEPLGLMTFQGAALVLVAGVWGTALWVRRLLLIAGADQVEAAWGGCLYLILAVVVPANYFGTRDHIAVLFMMPLLLMQMLGASRERIGLGERVASGMLGGLAVSFKPHYALIFILLAALQSLRGRRPVPLFRLELLTAGAFCILLIATLFSLYPSYLDYLLMLREGPARAFMDFLSQPLSRVLDGLLFNFALLLSGFVFLSRDPGTASATAKICQAILFAAGLAILPLILQGKGLYYHFIGTILLGGLAGGLLLLSYWRRKVSGIDYRSAIASALIGFFLLVPASSFLRLHYSAWIKAPITAFPDTAHGEDLSQQLDILSAYPTARVAPLGVIGNNHHRALALSPATTTFNEFCLWYLSVLYEAKAGEAASFRSPEQMGRLEAKFFEGSVKQLLRSAPTMLIVPREKPDSAYYDVLAYLSQDARVAQIVSAFSPAANSDLYLFYVRN